MLFIRPGWEATSRCCKRPLPWKFLLLASRVNEPSTSKFTILYLSDCFQLKPDEFAASQGRPQQPFRLFCSVSANPTPSPSYPTSLKTSQWNPCLDTSSLNKSWAFSTLKVQTKLEPGRLLKEEVRLIRKTPFCFFSSSWKSRFWNQRFASNFCFSSFAEKIKKKENENLRITVFCLIEYFWCLIFFR